MKLFFDKNYLVFLLTDGYYRIYNPVLHLNFIIDINLMDFFNKIEKFNNLNVLKKKYLKKKFLIEETTDFTLFENMYNNPDFINKKLPKLNKKKDITVLIKYLLNKKIISYKKNQKYNLNKKNFFDRFKGNINEQIAYECLISKTKIKDWWISQKFKNTKILKETPYKYIQYEFLKKYFKNNLKKKKVLEIASGNGFWCNEMANYANLVYGIDYEDEYVNISKKNFKNNKLNFFKYDIKDNNLHKKLNIKFDYIFLIDFFLFLFDKKFQNNLFLKKNNIFNNINKLLSRKGKILIVDPHFFWLTPQFGNLNHPYGIVTEYNNRNFKTIPTLAESSKLFFESGFCINRIFEPLVNSKYSKTNEGRYNFMNEFPQWIVYELIKRS